MFSMTNFKKSLIQTWSFLILILCTRGAQLGKRFGSRSLPPNCCRSPVTICEARWAKLASSTENKFMSSTKAQLVFNNQMQKYFVAAPGRLTELSECLGYISPVERDGFTDFYFMSGIEVEDKVLIILTVEKNDRDSITRFLTSRGNGRQFDNGRQVAQELLWKVKFGNKGWEGKSDWTLEFVSFKFFFIPESVRDSYGVRKKGLEGKWVMRPTFNWYQGGESRISNLKKDMSLKIGNGCTKKSPNVQLNFGTNIIITKKPRIKITKHKKFRLYYDYDGKQGREFINFIRTVDYRIFSNKAIRRFRKNRRLVERLVESEKEYSI